MIEYVPLDDVLHDGSHVKRFMATYRIRPKVLRGVLIEFGECFLARFLDFSVDFLWHQRPLRSVKSGGSLEPIRHPVMGQCVLKQLARMAARKRSAFFAKL